MRSCLSTLLLLAFSAGTAYSDTISNWNGGTGNWSTTGDWTPPTIPNNSGMNAYAVTVGSGSTDVVTLDVSPTIDSLTVGANAGSSTVQGVFGAGTPVLTVLNDMTVKQTGNVNFSNPLQGSLTVGGTLTNAGTVTVYPGSVSAGNLVNSGMMVLAAEPIIGTTFRVTGNLTNNGVLQLGFGFPNLPPGPPTSIGSLSNNGTLIADSTQITLSNQPAGITDIPAGSRLELDGSSIQAAGHSAFANLTNIAGALYFNVSPQTVLVNPQNNSQTLSVAPTGSLTFFDGQNWTVGNITNLGTVFTGADERSQGPNVLTIAGTLANGGSMTFADPGRFSTGDSLNVGVPIPGTTSAGYHQTPDSVLEELVLSATSYGTIDVAGSASLSGALDVLLENGFTPTVGESFTILTFAPGELSGMFDRVLNPYFAVTYDNADGRVIVTAEGVPEPAEFFLVFAGLFAVLILHVRRRRKPLVLVDGNAAKQLEI